MTTPRSIKIIKNDDRKDPETQTEAEPSPDPGKWSTEVRSWVVEFKEQRQVESLPGFESLFKDALPE